MIKIQIQVYVPTYMLHLKHGILNQLRNVDLIYSIVGTGCWYYVAHYVSTQEIFYNRRHKFLGVKVYLFIKYHAVNIMCSFIYMHSYGVAIVHFHICLHCKVACIMTYRLPVIDLLKCSGWSLLTVLYCHNYIDILYTMMGAIG